MKIAFQGKQLTKQANIFCSIYSPDPEAQGRDSAWEPENLFELTNQK